MALCFQWSSLKSGVSTLLGHFKKATELVPVSKGIDYSDCLFSSVRGSCPLGQPKKTINRHSSSLDGEESQISAARRGEKETF